MHMSDALINPAVAGAMFAASALVTGISVKKIRLEEDPKKVPVMGIMGAFVFAAQMINFTIPGTGSSGHLCGGMLLSAILGPYAGFLTMIAVLLIQCLIFADGGLLALGCNVWNMAFYSCFLGGLLIWKFFMKNGASKGKIIYASIIGSLVSLQAGAFSVTLETFASGVTELPFITFVAAMQPIHLAIGLVEGLITAAVLIFIYEARPEILWGIGETCDKSSKLSLKATLVVLASTTVVIGGLLSLVASSNPDGLEWSVERLTGSTEIAVNGSVNEQAGIIQEKTSILPDYSFKNSDTAAGTSLSGIIGAVLVVIVTVGACYAFRLFRHKDKTELTK
ncbi:MAG: energy-coupling factor ABC transporter permease [Lachnospira sp.]